jgi:hypothetical protein
VQFPMLFWLSNISGWSSCLVVELGNVNRFLGGCCAWYSRSNFSWWLLNRIHIGYCEAARDTWIRRCM